jgi:hypothetical protein
MTERLDVRNPVAELATAPTPRAPRAKAAGGSRLGLWWNKKPGGDVVLERLADRLAPKLASETKHYYGRYPGAPAFIEDCAAWSDVVVGSTGD